MSFHKHGHHFFQGNSFIFSLTVLLGKRVDFDHCVVSADFSCESCMYSVLILYTVRSMVGLPTCQIVECDELLSGIWRGKCPKFVHFYVRL